MVQFTVYDAPTGQILRNGEAQENTLGMQLQGEGEAITFGAHDPETVYFRNGQATARPVLPLPSIEPHGLTFPELAPEGTMISLSSTFVEMTEELTSLDVAVMVPELMTVDISPPFPWVGGSLSFTPSGGPAPDGAMIVAPRLDVMISYFSAALYQKGDELVSAMLGNPSEATRRRWLIKRSVYDRSLVGTITDSDRLALEAGVKYSGISVEEELAVIGARVGFENWVTFRADGVRSEAMARVSSATGPSEVLAAIAWAEAESGQAVAEAMDMK